MRGKTAEHTGSPAAPAALAGCQRASNIRRAVAFALLLLLLATSLRAHPGWGIQVDAEGAVWFVDLERETIWRCDPAGSLRAFPVERHLHRLHRQAAGKGIAFDHQQYSGPPVTVGDPPRLEEAGTRRVSYWRLEENGHVAAIIPPTPTVYPRRDRPVVDDFGSGLTLLHDTHGRSYGIVYSAGTSFPSLQRRSPASLEGAIEVLAERVYELDADGTPRPPELSFLQAMAWGRGGSILLTEGGRVRRLERDGRLSTLGGDPLGDDVGSRLTVPVADRVLGVAEDANGVVYAADYGRRTVRRIDLAGEVTRVRRARWGWAPVGVAVDAGTLYVLEVRSGILQPFLRGLNGPRVVRVGSDGAQHVLATVDGRRLTRAKAASAVVGLGILLAIGLHRRRSA